MHIYELRDPATVVTVALQMAQADSGGILFETSHRRKDGTTFPVEVSSIGADISGEHVLLSIIRDITERKQAEVDLRESEERFRATFDQAAVGMAQISPDGHYVRVNERLCEIIGYSHAELLQKTYQSITHPDDLATDQGRNRTSARRRDYQLYDRETLLAQKWGQHLDHHDTFGGAQCRGRCRIWRRRN